MRIGITGHSNLVPECLPAVHAALAEVLGELTPPLVGVSCLAPGADQVFARVVLELGGAVEVVLPAMDYRDKMAPEHRDSYDDLLRRASVVSVLPHLLSGRQAYVAANERMLASIDLLVAVWDGVPAAGKGGTAETVEHARACGVPVQVVWPPEARRA
ncbi:MAG TPA: hypothetical protein VGP03_02640 [Pseudonocardiaceae bacterium]|jgi:hypothetical protein|nr:hypothetical protein [Pseudonocardiaceae bacterium]